MAVGHPAAQYFKMMRIAVLLVGLAVIATSPFVSARLIGGSSSVVSRSEPQPPVWPDVFKVSVLKPGDWPSLDFRDDLLLPVVLISKDNFQKHDEHLFARLVG